MNATHQRVAGKGFVHPKTPPRQTSAPLKGVHYRLTNEEWLTLWDNLRPAEIKVLLHLRTLDPFGDRTLEIGVRDLGRTLSMDHSTVSRALKTLDKKGYIDLDLIQVNVRVQSNRVAPDTTGGSKHHRRSSDTTGDRQTPPTVELETPAIPDSEDPQAFSTESPFVPEQTLKNVVNNRSGATPTPAPEPFNGKGYSAICDLIPERAGVPLNPALVSVIEEVEMRHPEESYTRVCNAISAYIEQKATVRNPQAFISAALKRGFTSNQAKRQKRPSTEKQKKTTLPPAPMDLSGLIAEIQIHCQRLQIPVKQALERFGRVGRSLNDLTDLDLATLRLEMAGW